MASYLDKTGLIEVLSKIKTWVNNNYVSKESGKGLSANDFTTTLKNKLDGIASGAQANVIETVKVNGTALTPSSKAVNITVPTNNNQLTNGAGYQTASQVSSAISTAIGGVTQFDLEVVTALPTTGVKGKIYLMAHSHGTGDAYDEYIWTGSAYEKIGNTDVDLSNYVTKTGQSVIVLYVKPNGQGSYIVNNYGSNTNLTYEQFRTIAINHAICLYDLDGENEFLFPSYVCEGTNCIEIVIGYISSHVKYTFKSDLTYTESNTEFQTVINSSNKLSASYISGLNSVATNGVPDASTTVKGITTVGASGGAAAYSHTHSYYSKPSGGIPKTDLASAVQTSLGKADTALQSHQSIKTLHSKTLTGSGDVTLTASDVGAVATSAVGVSGGVAAYSHSHSYTNDSAMSSTDIAGAFTTAEMTTTT